MQRPEVPIPEPPPTGASLSASIIQKANALARAVLPTPVAQPTATSSQLPNSNPASMQPTLASTATLSQLPNSNPAPTQPILASAAILPVSSTTPLSTPPKAKAYNADQGSHDDIYISSLDVTSNEVANEILELHTKAYETWQPNQDPNIQKQYYAKVQNIMKTKRVPVKQRGDGKLIEILAHQFAAVATIIRPRRIIQNPDHNKDVHIHEAPNSLISAAPGSGKTIIMALAARLFMELNESNQVFLCVPDFADNNTFLTEINRFMRTENTFQYMQPPIYKNTGSSSNVQYSERQYSDADARNSSFHTAFTERLNRIKDSYSLAPHTSSTKKTIQEINNIVHRNTYMTDMHHERAKAHRQFQNKMIHNYFSQNGLGIGSALGGAKTPSYPTRYNTANDHCQWSLDERNLEWSRMVAHAFHYNDRAFKSVQYSQFASNGLGSFFTDLLRAILFGNECLVILDEFHSIFSEYEGPDSKYHRDLQNMTKVLLAHPCVRMVILTATPELPQLMDLYRKYLVCRPYEDLDRVLKQINGDDWRENIEYYTHDQLPHYKQYILGISKLGDSWLHHIANHSQSIKDKEGKPLLQFLHKVNLLTYNNSWLNTSTNRLPLVEFNPPNIVLEKPTGHQAKSNVVASLMRQYSGVIVYDHWKDRGITLMSITSPQACDEHYKRLVDQLKIYIGNNVGVYFIGSAMCEGNNPASKGLVGRDLDYTSLAEKICDALEQDPKQRESILFQIANHFMRQPNTPSPSSWFFRFLIKTTVAGLRLKDLRTLMGAAMKADHKVTRSNDTRAVVFIDGDFKGKHAETDEKLLEFINSFTWRAVLTADIYLICFDQQGDENSERLQIVRFDTLCDLGTGISGFEYEKLKDQLGSLVTSIRMAMGLVPDSTPTNKAVTIDKTNITYVPNNETPGKQLKCIHSQTPKTKPEKTAHIYIVDGTQWTQSLNMKQFSIQQVNCALEKCATTRQLLGRVRRLGSQSGPWTSHDETSIEIFTDINFNSLPYKLQTEDSPPLLDSCITSLRPYMATLKLASECIEGIKNDEYDYYDKAWASVGYTL